MRHPIRFIVSFAILASAAFFAYQERVQIRDWVYQLQKPDLPIAQEYSDHIDSTSTIPQRDAREEANEPEESNQGEREDILPSEKLLSVPFTSQAPHANWDMPYQEACEEASILMVAGYYRGERGAYDAGVADRNLLNIISFEEDMGLSADITIAEAKRVVEEYYSDLEAEIISITDRDDIRRYIARGIPVIIPADGKVLPNPNFQNGGPVYHMLVVIGYTNDGLFITNDPGTRLGEKFLYEEQALIDAIHDWNGGDVPNGAKIGLVLMKE